VFFRASSITNEAKVKNGRSLLYQTTGSFYNEIVALRSGDSAKEANHLGIPPLYVGRAFFAQTFPLISIIDSGKSFRGYMGVLSDKTRVANEG
jgi:hypothetical protein